MPHTGETALMSSPLPGSWVVAWRAGRLSRRRGVPRAIATAERRRSRRDAVRRFRGRWRGPGRCRRHRCPARDRSARRRVRGPLPATPMPLSSTSRTTCSPATTRTVTRPPAGVYLMALSTRFFSSSRSSSGTPSISQRPVAALETEVDVLRPGGSRPTRSVTSRASASRSTISKRCSFSWLDSARASVSNWVIRWPARSALWAICSDRAAQLLRIGLPSAPVRPASSAR